MINLTIQSENLKTIDLIQLSNFNITNTFLNNESVNIPYDNYIIKLLNSDSSYTMVNFWSISETVLGKIIFIVVIGIIIISVLIFINHLKKM